MILKSFFIVGFMLLLISCQDITKKNIELSATTINNNEHFENGYRDVHGLHMYYEIYGKGEPLVLIHGGGSTIQTSFGRIIPLLAKKRMIVAVELQAHGHTRDIERLESFVQDADDVALLLDSLKIMKADFLGFSNGGNTTMQIAIRHPDVVNKIIVASSFFKREGMQPHFWEGMEQATIESMPQKLREAYLQVNPDSAGLTRMFSKDKARMVGFSDWKEDDLRSIKVPTLIISGDQDVVRPEHAVEMFRLFPKGELAILPGGHGKYMGEVTTLSDQHTDSLYCVPLIEDFLIAQVKK